MANGKEQRRRSGKARNGSDRNIFRWFSWKRGPKIFRRSMNRMRTSRDTQEEDGAILQRTSTLMGERGEHLDYGSDEEEEGSRKECDDEEEKEAKTRRRRRRMRR